MRKIAKIAAVCAAFGLALFAAGCSNSSDPLRAAAEERLLTFQR